MSHRKFERPRHGNLGFLPRKRCTRTHGKLRSFPNDDPTAKPHLTAFMGYKVGSTHISRDLNRQGSGLHLKEICEQVSYIETPPVVVAGIVGYKETVNGLKTHTTVWASKLGEEYRRNLIKGWYKSKKKAFTKYSLAEDFSKKNDEKLKAMGEVCTVVRVIVHTQPKLTPQLGRKKAQVMEIQINGGSAADKVKFAQGLLEQTVSVSSVFKKDELVDQVGITKGKGFQGVVKRWGVRKLPRKTHKGLRKVACIGSWHPARVSYTIARAGQMGFHHRTKYNNKVFMVGKELAHAEGKVQGKTEFDLTEKGVNPMGGFPHYGLIRNEFLMIKGNVIGPQKRLVLLRKSLYPKTNRVATEETKLKFIDTSSKLGRGRFQTSAEKRSFMGPLKKELEKKREEDLKKLAEERKKKEEEDKLKKEAKVEKTEESKDGKEKKKEKKDKKKKKKKVVKKAKKSDAKTEDSKKSEEKK